MTLLESMSMLSKISFAIACLVVATGCTEGAPADLPTSEAPGQQEEGLKIDCSYVKCAFPVCADGQHVVQTQGTCCPTCVGKPSRCAAVMCAAVMCNDGEQLVTTPGNCCGTCRPVGHAPECKTDLDCPAFACITCPCPQSTCDGQHCRTWTPDGSTCGAQ
jgi:hypothetical protein